MEDGDVTGYATFPRRMYALIVDVVVMTAVLMGGVIVISFAIPDSVAGVVVGTIIGIILLYDPILVSVVVVQSATIDSTCES